MATDPGMVALSASAYRLLLLFYPTRFRKEYGLHMAQVFRDCCLQTYRHSRPRGMLSLWALTLFDWIKTVIEEQLDRGTEMTRAKFIRLSGWGLILAAISLLLTFPEQIQTGLVKIFGTPAEIVLSRYWLVGWLPMFAAIFLIMMGLLGLRARFRQQASRAAQAALEIGALAGAAAAVTYLLTVFGLLPSRHLVNIFMAVMFAGLLAFGLATGRARLLPRGNGYAVLAGIWWPLLVIDAYVFPLGTAGYFGQAIPLWFTLTIFTLISIPLALLGYALQADAPQAEEIAPYQV